jgi:hypothetical protein
VRSEGREGERGRVEEEIIKDFLNVVFAPSPPHPYSSLLTLLVVGIAASGRVVCISALKNDLKVTDCFDGVCMGCNPVTCPSPVVEPQNNEGTQMQRIFSALKQALGNLLILVLVGLLVSSLFVFAPTAMAAAPISTGGQKLIQQETLDKESQAANREQAYEEQVEAEKDPDKVYEKNLKSYKSSHPGANPIEKTVEGAEKLVEKVTGNQ